MKSRLAHFADETGIRSFLRPQILQVLLVGFVLVIPFAIATRGHLSEVFQPSVSLFFDAQLQSIMEGRLDVPVEALGNGAFIRDGKSYGYFGMLPSLVRIPVLLMFPSAKGRLSLVSMLLAVMITSTSMILIGRRSGFGPLRGRIIVVYVWLWYLCATIGSTQVSIAADPNMFVEPIRVGSGFRHGRPCLSHSCAAKTAIPIS